MQLQLNGVPVTSPNFHPVLSRCQEPQSGLHECMARRPGFEPPQSTLSRVDHCNRLLYAVQSSYFPSEPAATTTSDFGVANAAPVNSTILPTHGAIVLNLTTTSTSATSTVISNLNSSSSAFLSQNFPTHFISQIWVHLVCVLVGFLLGCVCYRVIQSGFGSLIQWWSHCFQCIPQQPGHTRVAFAYVSAIPAARTQALAVSACLGSSYTTLSINESDLLV